jgi:pimeloyl-ACP methyl ester carboxylesterase
MTALQLPAPVAVEWGDPGQAVRGISWDWPGADLSLLLVHPPGADLDHIRWLADRLVAAGVSVLSIDLPGHGLSDGDALVPDRGGRAIAHALAELGHGGEGVAAVAAQGQSAGLLLGTELAQPPLAAILLDPQPMGPGQRVADGWRLVPKLLLVPAGRAHLPFATQIVESTNAWTLQADLHGFSGAERTETAEVQMTSLALKFTLELAAYELVGRRAAGPG